MNEKVFYEDELEALRATVQQLGGYKAVGGKLWPDKNPDVAGRLLADCCNAGRTERLKPSQLLFVMRLARDAGVHILADHFMQVAGYAKPTPVSPADEANALHRRLDDTLRHVSDLVGRLEKIRGGGEA